jgi:hypothetical protein
MTNIKFNAADLDHTYYIKRAREETKEIYSKETSRKNRTFVEIFETTLYGHAPEVYLIEKCGFTDDKRKYKDVIHPDGSSVEIKVTEGDYYVPYVLERANEAAKESWRNYSETLYVFIGDKTTGDYTLHGSYRWEKTTEKFVLQKELNIV